MNDVMERTVALKRLRKMLGKGFAYKFNAGAPEPERRAVAIEERAELIANKQRLSKALEERGQALMAADAEYQRLKAECKTAREAVQANNDIILRHKITVGISSNLFFRVKAQGDSWEQIFEQLAKRRG